MAWLESIGRDWRYAVRQLRPSPGIPLVASIVFGLGPAMRRADLSQALRGSSATASRNRLGRALVAGQVARSLVLFGAASNPR